VGASSVCKDFKNNIVKALNDDLNISLPLSQVDMMIAKVNEELDQNPKNKNIKKTFMANLEFINSILGIGYQDAFEYFQFGLSKENRQKVKELIEKRAQAKKSKDFETADTIREELTKMNIEIMDTANGTIWEVK
jgi:cysteinyl-tRNA synthetase